MKTNKLSILDTIKKAVEELKWNSETKKEKALNLCICIYNLYVYDSGDFNIYKPLGKNYFLSIIKTKTYLYEIKNNLIDNGIIEVYKNGTYISGVKNKGYRFNQELINGNYTALNGPKYINNENQVALNGPKYLFQNISNLNFSINKSISNLNNLDLYHISGPKHQECIQSSFQRLKFRQEVNDYINNYKLKREDILINNDIKEEYINLKLENDHWRVSLEKAIEMAKHENKDLILYKEKAYIENEKDFIERKERELKLIFKKNVFEVENNIFRISRNETNRRLDYNLTNMKSDLLDYLEIDGESLIELDIANAQFAILSYLVEDLDIDFINKTQEGNLYNNDKKEWFRIAFDKIKKEQDSYRELYPKTMKFIDEYKREFGYKSFSILLQNTESLIMIDGVLPRLIEKYDIFPIHDAIRVKASQVNEVKKEIDNFFKDINFKCLVRNKKEKQFEKEKETEIINFKGFKQVEIDKVTQEDKKLFISKINALKDINLEPSESLLLDMNIFSYEKTCYLYDKWRKSNPYKEYKIKE